MASYRFNKWSNSSLTTLQMCAHKFYLRHLQRDRRPSGLAAKRGTAVHKVALEAHKRQMAMLGKWRGDEPEMQEEPGTLRSMDEARDMAATAFEHALSRDGVAYTKDDMVEGIQISKARAKDAAIDLSELYVDVVVPRITPEAVERKVTIKPKNSAITIEGRIDLVQSDNGDVIRDLKTKEKAPWEGEARVSQQLTMYHLIRLAETGTLPKAGRLVHLVRTPARHELKVVEQETTRSNEDIGRLVERINTAVAAVERGVFVPADESAPGSPCGYCEYADGTCKYVRRRQ